MGRVGMALLPCHLSPVDARGFGGRSTELVPGTRAEAAAVPLEAPLPWAGYLQSPHLPCTCMFLK